MSSTLEGRLLGAFEVKHNKKTVSISSRPAQSLFAHLILTAGTAHRREKLAGMLWPDSLEETARDNLRHALWRIRKALPSKPKIEYLLADDLSIASNRGTITNFSSAVWQAESFGADQEAYFTFIDVDPNGGEQDLLLKESHNGLIEVLYDATHDDIGVWTYSDAQGWVRHGDYIPVTFNDGDQFGARAKANGDVEVYKNGVLLGVRGVSSWEYYAGGGRIGIWFVDVTGALLDDFGGGTLSGGEGLMAQGSGFSAGDSSEDDLLERLQTIPKPTRVPSATNTPTLTPTPPKSGLDFNPIANFAPVNFKLPAPALDTWNQTLETLIIDYTYDPLNRLTSATYSDGRNFAYTYDASGNVLELEQNLGPGTVITTYTYDTANQLETAQQDSTSWQYTYDANGSLISDGVKNYTYDSANRLIEVSDQSMTTTLEYNGLGQRLGMNAAGVIATYVLDGDRPLTAESGGNATFYLYGLGAIGEKTTEWNFSLPDGTNTPRQLTNPQGEITLAGRYTPWGDTLDTYGTGNFSYGYFGGLLDASTGLIYVGNGQYYDPSTGRFLTRDVNPDSTNPYVPWNPIGAILGPLGLIALVFGRRKKGSKTGTILVLLLVMVTVGITLSACGGGGSNDQEQSQPVQNPNPNSNQTPVDTNPGTDTGSSVSSFGSATQSPTFTPCTPTPMSTSTPTPIPTSTPIPISCDDLSDVRARRACRTYLALRDHSGWWNGNQPGSLTPQAFAGLLLRMEFSDSGGSGFNLVDHSIQQETVVRKFYSSCDAWPQTKCDTREANDMFIFIGTQGVLEGRRGLQMNPTDTSTTIASKWVFNAGWSTADFESAFLNPPGAWKGIGPKEWIPELNTSVYVRPMDWGNISMIQIGLHPERYQIAWRLINEYGIEKATGLAENRFYIVKGYGDSATIVTLTQRRYWRGG